jgi:hypothetical protein
VIEPGIPIVNEALFGETPVDELRLFVLRADVPEHMENVPEHPEYLAVMVIEPASEGGV